MEYYAPVQGSPSTFAGLEADPATGGTTGVVLSLPQLDEWHHMHHASSPNSATDTGLEEAVWQLSLQGAEGMESVPGSYPERPGEQECTYYMRTGLCGFGMSCRYHHPPNRKLAAMLARGKGEYPERIGQPECQYYLKTGMCKFGATCKYHHPRDKAGSAGRVQLNLLGFPLRAGEKECAYYMRTGACKYGVTCKFHHPSPAVGALVSMPSSPLYTTGGSPSGHNPQQYPPAIPSWPVARGSYLPSPRLQGPSNYAPLLLSSPHGVVPMSAWGYSPGPMASPDGQQQAALGTGFVYGPVQEHIAGVQGTFTPYLPGSAATGLPAMQAQQYGSQKDGMFPERPGQQECQYYMKTGDCKFGATCRYHHPKDRVTPSATCILSPMGLPIRPGAPQCTYYMRNGICKFGPTCKFDHPLATLAYNPSAEAPYAIVAPPTILTSGDAANQDGKHSISGTAIEDVDSQGHTPANKGSEEITAGINTSQGGTQVSSNGITSQADSAVSS